MTRWLSVVLGGLLLAGCGDHLSDTGSLVGQNAIKNQTNILITQGHCFEAYQAIKGLIDSGNADIEARLIAASAQACLGGFKFFDFIDSFTNSPAQDNFGRLALSFPVPTGSTKIENLYAAADLIFGSANIGGSKEAVHRSREANVYMVYMQFAIAGNILNKNGKPAVNGNRTLDLIYNVPFNPLITETISEEEACQLLASFTIMRDSLYNASFSNKEILKALNSIDEICADMNKPGCVGLPKVRTACDRRSAQTSVEYESAFYADQLTQRVNARWAR